MISRSTRRLSSLDSDTQDLIHRVAEIYGTPVNEMTLDEIEDILEDTEMLES